jgi:hypothetical protein
VPVPSDAALIVHIGGMSPEKGFPWEELKNSELYKNKKIEKDSLLIEIVENPESTGIDFSADFFYFIKKRESGDYYVFTLALKDDNAFAAHVKKGMKVQNVKKTQSLNVVEGKDGGLITWNGSRAVVIGNVGNRSSHFSAYNDIPDFEEEKYPEDTLIKFAKEVYNIKESESINNDKRFADLLTQPGQLHIWINSEISFADKLKTLPINTADKLIKGNVHTIAINFDKGKITGDSKSYYNQQLASYYTKNPPKNIDEDMLKKIPGENISAVFAMNYPMPVLKDMLALTGADTWVDLTLRQMDVQYSLNDLLNSLKGDFFIALSDASLTAQTVNESLNKDIGWGNDDQKKGDPMISGKILGGISLSDPAAFESMLAFARGKMEENGVPFTVMQNKFPYRIKDGWLLGSTDTATINSFGKSSIDHPFIRRIAGHPIGGYIDVQKLASGFKGSEVKLLANEVSATWQDILFYGGEMKDSTQIGHFEVNFVDKNTHSLKILIDFIGKQIELQRFWENVPISEEEKLKMFDSIQVDRKKVKIEEARP